MRIFMRAIRPITRSIAVLIAKKAGHGGGKVPDIDFAKWIDNVGTEVATDAGDTFVFKV